MSTKAFEKIVDQIETFVNPRIRDAILSEFKNIENLDEFLERTMPDPNQLLRTIESQKITLAKLRKKIGILEEDLKNRQQDKLPLFSIQLLELASLIVNQAPLRLIVGPFALWDDGNLYLMRSIGKSTLPAEPQINSILQIANEARRKIVEVHEETLIGGWISGPVYRSLGNDLNDWVEAWKCDKKFKRKFQTHEKEYIETISKIANFL